MTMIDHDAFLGYQREYNRSARSRESERARKRAAWDRLSPEARAARRKVGAVYRRANREAIALARYRKIPIDEARAILKRRAENRERLAALFLNWKPKGDSK